MRGPGEFELPNTCSTCGLLLHSPSHPLSSTESESLGAGPGRPSSFKGLWRAGLHSTQNQPCMGALTTCQAHQAAFWSFALAFPSAWKDVPHGWLLLICHLLREALTGLPVSALHPTHYPNTFLFILITSHFLKFFSSPCELSVAPTPTPTPPSLLSSEA